MPLRINTYSLFRISIISVIFFQSVLLQAQNLVLNPSFEDTVQCPTNLDQLSLAVGWYKPTGASSDYFNKCNINGMVDVPQNGFGSENPKTGDAYAGIYTFLSSSHPPKSVGEKYSLL